MAFGSTGMPPNSTYNIAPANNRLQKNKYGGGYHEVMDYGAMDAFPNPGYGTAAGIQDDDILVQKMADLMQNRFGLDPKMQGPTYTPPFPEWYYMEGNPHASSRARLKLGNHPGPSPGLPHAFSSTSGSVSRKRNATKS
jgi:hypothetical protein